MRCANCGVEVVPGAGWRWLHDDGSPLYLYCSLSSTIPFAEAVRLYGQLEADPEFRQIRVV